MKFPQNIKIIPVEDIAISKKFEYNLAPKNLDFVSSVRKAGILIPIWVCKNGRYEILDGYQRVKAAKLINLPIIPAIIFPKEYLKELFISSLYVNKFTRKMSVTEKLIAIHLANKFFSAGTASKVSYILEIPQIFNLREITQKIVKFPRWVKDYFHRKDIHMKLIGKLTRYSVKEYHCWFHMASSLNFNGTELTLLLDQIRDITIRDGVKPSQLWIDLGIDDLMKLDITSHQRVQKIKMKVESLRYPTLKNIQRKMKQEVKRVENKLSFHLDINWDNKLEQAGITMNIQIFDESELEEFFKTMGKDEFKNELTLLLDLMNQNPERMQ